MFIVFGFPFLELEAGRGPKCAGIFSEFLEQSPAMDIRNLFLEIKKFKF
jgi:hypothetical protein